MSETKQPIAARLEDYRVGDHYEVDGVEHESSEDILQIGLLGFCGCGQPDENLTYILGGLELIAETVETRGEYEAYFARELAHHGSDSALLFFKYWADSEGWSEHGGSVGGSWLTDDGERLLRLLREWKAASTAPASMP